MVKKISIFMFSTMLLTQCGKKEIKLSSDERYRVDTLANKQILVITPQLEKWCRDSLLDLKQKWIDSLILVREQEILKQTSTLPTPQ